MPAGTITLTNGSTAVTGSGTSFATELKANDFVVAVVGGVTYTLGVQAIGSATTLTLTTAYNGPTTSGLAWIAVPNAALVGITAQVAADVAKAVRGFNFDKVNWQKIFSNTASVTVTLPDLTSFTGPSWGYMAAQYASKANTSDVLTKADNLGSLADKAAARTNLGLGDLATLNGPLAINKGGTGSATPFGTTANTFAQGNDSRLGTIDGKMGGQLTTGNSLSVYGPVNKSTTTGQFNESPAFKMNINGTGTAGQMYSQWTSVEYVGNENYAQLRHVWGSTNVTWKFSWSGTATAQNGSWTNGSDSRIKDGLEVITDALNKVKQLNGYTGNRDGKSFTGVIAQELQKVLPEAVFNSGLYTLQTDINGLKAGETIADLLSVAYGDTVGLLVEAIKELSGIVDKQNTAITELQKRMKAIDGLDA